ncbi:MAG: DUF427 domain-containing protein [Sciscionella sp.]
MTIARFDGEVIAESSDTVLVEGNHYFPPHSVRSGLMRPSQKTTHCPLKGDAHYYSITVHGRPTPDAAWSYVEPSEQATMIRGHFAFAPLVTIEE